MLESFDWAHSKVVLHVHGMDEAGVRFPVGPQRAKRGVGPSVPTAWHASGIGGRSVIFV